MNFKKRSFIFVTFFVSCLAITLLAAALGTQHWVQAECVREGEFKNNSKGLINFGLFEGSRYLNYGFGERHYTMKMLDVLYRERKFLQYELYIGTISMVVGGMVFGVLAALLAILNTAYNPIEAICHIPGLYVTNGLAAVCSLAGVVTWMVQFYIKLTHNVVIREDRVEGRWSSKGMAVFGYSFWLVVLATLSFVLNIVIIALTTSQPKSRKKANALSLPGKQAGDTMLY